MATRRTSGRTIGLVILVLAACSTPDARSEHSRSGMQANIDPRTGALVPEPPGPTAPALPTPSRPRIAETPAPGGGMMADISGRFMSSLVATIEPDGSVRVDCVPADGVHAHP